VAEIETVWQQVGV